MDAPGIAKTAKHQLPTTIRIQHKDAPWLKDAAPGQEVKFNALGHVHSNRGADEFGDGEAEVDVHHINQVDQPTKKQNAANMSMFDLKNSIKSADQEE